MQESHNSFTSFASYQKQINKFWSRRATLTGDDPDSPELLALINDIFTKLEQGEIRVCNNVNGQWEVNEWIKQAILLYFKIADYRIYDNNAIRWYDKISLKFSNYTSEHFAKENYRIVPGSIIRSGTYLGKNTVIMPAFINIGAYVGENSLIDTWATIGSCAYIGKNCHISGGTGIGGVLEPLQSRPVIIEDNCFIGARSEIAEGVIVEEGSVISMGVFIGASTKIIDRYSGKITYGKIPAYSVVVPGSSAASDPKLPVLYCAVIIKKVDKQTREKVSINELLRS